MKTEIVEIDAVNIEDNEITNLNFIKYIDVINEMIHEIAIETETYIPRIIEDISNFYKIPTQHLKKALKTINSQYTENNNIVFYFEDSPMRRTAYTCAQRKIMLRLGKKLKTAYSGIENATDLFIHNTRLLLCMTTI